MILSSFEEEIVRVIREAEAFRTASPCRHVFDENWECIKCGAIPRLSENQKAEYLAVPVVEI